MQILDIVISTDEITLGQFLKFADLISSGGDVKWFLSEHEIYVNDQLENRRGKKLHHGDLVSIVSIGKFKIIQQSRVKG